MTSQDQDIRYKKVRFGAWVGIAGNVVLAVLKGIIGMLADSRALVADAVHSASDVVGSVAVLIGIRAAKQPPDEDHPYGHGKAETVTAIIVAVLLFVVGLEIAISAVRSFYEPIAVPGIIAIYAILFSIVVKELMFRYKIFLGKKYKSDALITDAWHHRSDVFSSLAALVGVGASIIGGNIGLDWLVYMDPAAGIFVSLLIMKMGWKLGSEAIHNTLDHVLHEEDTVDMFEKAGRVKGVLKIDELLAREHGHYVIVDIKIAVDPQITVEEGHSIGKEVKKELMEDGYVQDVRVHINPYTREET
ncbi:cation diffusion facilitator family transporter [Salipaludibacillus sp. CUR1]|uniref:cation diffusion facilitator family transporter n=1 Tax=Salipaludibacillus sp. CUR1 TaxID=2820003 RepID=UPI001E3E0D7D|nr:cation diffusion facilitator family transporter [Salipaludibacillus sp. CUR1]MCE7793762.1 cation diffusion facilitator family transporter [Salipaludibacillus sp. CUR1]